ncbi:hypothetical protein DPMN_050352 [Dreissena polymorpha]|uniref:EGF-like domain-containing protein n=1 Tax=Dreissena polymorpha TaxID=45954 RepID=A0A9D4CGK6_DREPO|nr:hypothetical protein DPMN_050352 [Dreissena polymorpha]
MHIDIDECQKRDQNDCHYYSNCTNTPGSYTCKCIEGYDDLEGNRGRRCEGEIIGHFFRFSKIIKSYSTDH